ncbi:dynamin family protein [Rhodococcus sp. NPDC054953]
MDVAQQPSTTGDAATPRQRADALLASITGKILRPFGQDELSELVLHRASGAEQTRSVVVVGEVKRGKSSLVNALVGWRDASPVGVDVTTSTTISLGEATDEQPGGTAQLLFPDRTEQIPHGELADWVSCEGIHVLDPRIEMLPTRAIVPVAGSRLGDVTVIDTPGVGGLDPSYAGLASASAAQACVLVIVCDATTPITAPEMAFIRDTGSAVESLIVVVTKTDKNVRRWKPIVEQNRALLREHLGRDVPVLGVSSLRAVLAAQMPPGSDRDLVERRSGITELRRLIHTKLAVAENLPAANGLRTAVEGLRTLSADMSSQIETLTKGAEVIPDLTAQLEELQSLKDHSQQWELHLQRDMTLIRQNATDDLDRSLDQIREKWTTRINKNGMAVLRKNPQHFTAEMEHDFQAAMAGAITVFLEQLHDKIVAPRFESEVVWNEISAQVLAELSGRKVETHQVTGKRQGLLDPSMITMGVMGSSMIGGLIGVSALVGVGAVVGVAWVGFNLGFKAMRAGKTNLIAWMRETIGTTKTTTARGLDSAIALVRPEIVIRYREHLKSSIEALQKQIKAAEDAARTDKASREKKLTRLEGNLKVVTGNIGRAEALITELTTTAGGGSR